MTYEKRGTARVATDQSMANQLRKPGSRTQEATIELIQPVVAANPDVVAAGAAAAVAAVNSEVQARGLVVATDDRFVARGDATGSNAWTDVASQASLYDDADGTVWAPKPIASPGVGLPMETEWDDGTIWDPISGAVREGATKNGKIPAETLAAWATRGGFGGGGSSTATRTVPALVTGSAGATMKDTNAAVHARGLVTLPAWATEVRIHVRNYNDRDDLAYGNVAATAMYLGRPARSSGVPTSTFAAAPVQVLGSGTVSGNAETVGPWVSVDRGGLFLLSYAYTATGDTHAGIGGGWTSTATGEVAQTTPTTAMTAVKQLPLDIWFEVRIPARMRIVAAITDSHGLASNSETPMLDSFAVKWAESAGVALWPMSNHGSTLASWANTAQWKWQKYAGLSRPDAAVIFVGSNNIFNGDSLAASQSQFGQVVDAARAVLCDQVYAATLFARYGAATDSAKDAVRRSYNDWLLSLPNGIVNAFDISTVLEDPATSNPVQVRASMISNDNVHLSRRGHRAASAQIQVS